MLCLRSQLSIALVLLSLVRVVVMSDACSSVPRPLADTPPGNSWTTSDQAILAYAFLVLTHTLFIVFCFAGSWVKGGLLARSVSARRSSRAARAQGGRENREGTDLEAAAHTSPERNCEWHH